MKSELLQMKISLNWIKPEIWRRFVVDSRVSLDEFHEILQVVMGWTNSHLYSFTVHGVDYMPADDEFEMDESEDTKGMSLKKLKLEKGDKIRYVYDMGDDWEHTIRIEKVFTLEEETKVPYCSEGERNCPPEDCGGAPGYEDIVKAMQKPRSKEAKELIEWLGEIYDPEKFDLEEINEVLQPEKKKRKKRAAE
ncbi:MAG: plasmid pRiA4b ORF-3 family protein [Chitinivibrionales bacterium]|nr:plasmid pRiA4b ORF-3 family protein [Chitinivibrionales bacterium]